ncbi:C40 family peptidase [Angustibacter peucedani]
MTTTPRALSPALVRLLVVLVTAAGLTVPQLLAATPAHGATPTAVRAVTVSRQLARRAVPARVAARAVRYAATRKGSRYHLGSAGPRRFDCSGLTQWSYRHAGRRIPRSSQQQWRATRHVHTAQRRVGDLVFFFHGKRAYHVGIYAGHGQIWHAPKPGSRVKKVRLWTSHVRYGRVR